MLINFREKHIKSQFILLDFNLAYYAYGKQVLTSVKVIKHAEGKTTGPRSYSANPETPRQDCVLVIINAKTLQS